MTNSTDPTTNQRISVAVDALGGDDAPGVVLAGVRELLTSDFASDRQIDIVLTGYAQDIEPLAAEFRQRVTAVPTTEFIAMDEHPANAVKQKKNSSIVVACNLVKDGQANAFFSAGSTGAAMSAATLIIGRIKGIKRPAIATIIPAPKGKVVLLDSGANTDVTAEYLVQFAKMGSIYAKQALGAIQPRVGLLNVGSEDTKGSQLAIEAHGAILEQLPNFSGNAEGDDIFVGKFDVIVTDGFTGNVVLKTLEGTVHGLFSELKKIFYASTKNKLAAAVIKNDLNSLKDDLDANVIGGAPLLGLNNVVIIGHGSSNATAICNGIRAAAAAVRSQVPELIKQSIESQVGSG